jgi:uncharacterized protein
VVDLLEVDRSLRFVADEASAAELDAEVEEDVLALTHTLDLKTLVEDELLLVLPVVPRHETCPEPLPVPGAETAGEPEARQNPFAALQALKRERSGGNSH